MNFVCASPSPPALCHFWLSVLFQNNVKTSFAFAMGRAEDTGGDRDAESGEDRPFVPMPRPRQHSSAQNKPINSFFSIHRHMMESDSKSIPRRNKRKQLSPRRSSCDDDDYLTEKAYLPSWSTGTLKTVPLRTDGGGGNVTNYKQMKILV